MIKARFLAPALLAAAALWSAPALALGPVDVEAGLNWWRNDLRIESPAGAGESEADAPAAHAALWVKNFGVRASVSRSEVDDGAELDYSHIEFAWKPVSVTRNNYVALGVGAERIKFDFGGGDDTTTGVRVSAEGRVALGGFIYAYAQGAYYPKLGDLGVAPGTVLDDLEGRQVEVGVGIKPLPVPFLWLRVAYRDERLRGDVRAGGLAVGRTTLESKGVMAGLTFNF